MSGPFILESRATTLHYRTTRKFREGFHADRIFFPLSPFFFFSSFLAFVDVVTLSTHRHCCLLVCMLQSLEYRLLYFASRLCVVEREEEEQNLLFVYHFNTVS
jgi:hypothetical protein